MNYTTIFKIAYHVTRSNPRLWVLGIFLATSFNLQLLALGGVQSFLHSWRYGGFLTSQLGILDRGTVLPLSLIILGIMFLIVTNWAKASLILSLQYILPMYGIETFVVKPGTLSGAGVEASTYTQYNFIRTIIQSKQFIGSIVLVSLFTTLISALTVTIVRYPFISFAKHTALTVPMFALAGVLLAGSVFVISVLGMFAAFCIVLLRLTTARSINVAADLIFAKWRSILGVVTVLGVIYCSLFLLGQSVVQFSSYGFSSHIYGLAQTIKYMLLWGWLSILNVFFYTVMFLCFIHLIRPQKSEQPIIDPVVHSAKTLEPST